MGPSKALKLIARSLAGAEMLVTRYPIVCINEKTPKRNPNTAPFHHMR